MLSLRRSPQRTQSLITIGVFVLGFLLAWQAGERLADGDLRTIEFGFLFCACCGAAVAVLRSWRTGFYLFLMWMLFGDLVRKYLGNNMVLQFGPDILAGLTYISLLIAIRKRREKTFRPPFLLPLAIFVWLGAIQIFNTNSPSFLYGLLGFKLDFFYIPLIWVGYALIRSEEDLRKFLVVNAATAVVIAAVGIIQAIHGNSFLNPSDLAPDLARLGDLTKYTPIGHEAFNLPPSVFVSSGRFAAYLAIAFIVMLGATAYLILSSAKGRKTVFAAIAMVTVAALLSGSRGAVIYVAASALIMTVGFLWGRARHRRQSRLLLKAIRRTAMVGALGLAGLLVIFPDQAGTRIAFYMQTLTPSSSAYEGSWRGYGYPMENLRFAFTNPNWVLGNGLGVASLGAQYVAAILHEPEPDVWVEEGYGVLIVELGVVAPFLWLLWCGVLLYFCWKIVTKLRGTRFFPVAFAITWYAFFLLIYLTWGGFAMYQNYVDNAYLWMLIGVLFSLPDLLTAATLSATPASCVATLSPSTVDAEQQ